MACRAVLSLGSALRSQSTRRKKVRASTAMSFKRLCDDKRSYKCTRAQVSQQSAELCCWGSGFSRRQSSLFLIIIIPFVVIMNARVVNPSRVDRRPRRRRRREEQPAAAHLAAEASAAAVGRRRGVDGNLQRHLLLLRAEEAAAAHAAPVAAARGTS